MESTLSRNSNVAARPSYGWVMVVVAAAAMVATLPGRTHGLGMITERLLADPAFGLTRTGFGQINLWATLAGSLFCLGIGACVDRFGIRWSMGAVMLLLGAIVVGMTQLTSWQLLFFAVLLTRGVGQSALSVVSISIVGKWFDKHVSMPMAVYAVLMAAGFIAAALAGRSCANLDWRVFWAGIGACILALSIVLTLFARDRDDHRAASESSGENLPPSELGFTQGEAIRTRMFWVCGMGISLYGMIAAGISLFNESILVDQGFSTELYYESLAWGTAIGLLAKFIAGWLGVRVPVNRLLAAALFLLAVSLVWLTQLETLRDVIGYVALSATAGGMLTVLFFSAWPELYGRAHLGKIQGAAQMMTVIASAFGPLVFAQSKEWTGSYHPLLWILCGAAVAMSAMAWLTPLPTKPSSSTKVS